MRTRAVATLIELAKKDPNVVLVTGDLGFGVLKPYWEAVPKQFINAGIAEGRFGAQVLYLPQRARGKPLPRHAVGRHGIHVDEPRAAGNLLFHGNQIICGFPIGIPALFQIDRVARLQKLRASPCVLHMHPLRFPIDLHHGNEAVRAGSEYGLTAMFISHNYTEYPAAVSSCRIACYLSSAPNSLSTAASIFFIAPAISSSVRVRSEARKLSA